MADTKTKILNSMKYGEFTWANNPSECSIQCEKVFAKHKYPNYKNIDLEDFDMDAMVLTGNGEFFGTNAYKNWRLLLNEYAKNGVRTLYHPIYTNLRFGLMTKLSSNIPPRKDYISYTFEIIAGYNINNNTNAIVLSAGISGPAGNGANTYGASLSDTVISDLKVGDVIIVSGDVYNKPDGGVKITTIDSLRTTITEISNGSAYPIHYGNKSYGWVKKSSVTKYYTSSALTVSSNRIRHVVKINETIQSICTNYGISDWKSVAAYNGIKNINTLRVGQVIIINK